MTATHQRFVGIELGGSRRTAVLRLDYFAQEKKAFVGALESPLFGAEGETADEALIRTVNGMEANGVAVDAPLSLPPCVTCTLVCPGVRRCTVDAVEWMRKEAAVFKLLPTPYSQRPVDLLLRGRWQEDGPFPTDESFGSSRAPLATRMQYLLRHLHAEKILEAMPRLVLGAIAHWYGLSARQVRLARDVEVGFEQRLGILEGMGQKPSLPLLPQLFLYQADVLALAKDLSAFDAFLCAFASLLEHLQLLEPLEFPAAWGWVAKPRRWVRS